MGVAKKGLIKLVIAASCLAACTTASHEDGAARLDPAPPPPRYLGVYADDGSGLTAITYNWRYEDTVISRRRPSFYTYGIDLNAGLLAPMDPSNTVGVVLGNSPEGFYLEIEPLDAGSLYFRYTLREGVDLPDGDYNFFIRERFGGTRALQARFRVVGAGAVAGEER